MKDYQKYKWFFTSTGELVVGGKSAVQNDLLLQKIKSTKQEFIIMHTSEPGSPFTVIIENPKKVSLSDMEQQAIFTGCFSRAWRSGKLKTQVDMFKASQLTKPNSTKVGTWHVKPPVKHKSVDLTLVLTKQKGVLRAIPESALTSKTSAILTIKPGKTDKAQMLQSLKPHLQGISEEEILGALPAGGLSIVTPEEPKSKKPKTTKKKKASKTSVSKKRKK